MPRSDRAFRALAIEQPAVLDHSSPILSVRNLSVTFGGILAVNGEKVGEVDMDKTTPFIFCIEGLSIGYDYGDTVDHENYRDAFHFTGTIKKVTYDVSGEAIHDAEAIARRLLGRQ